MNIIYWILWDGEYIYPIIRINRREENVDGPGDDEGADGGRGDAVGDHDAADVLQGFGLHVPVDTAEDGIEQKEAGS